MGHYQAGDTSVLAEMIIDYEKKKVQILEPIERKKIKETDFNFSLDSLILLPFVVFSFFSAFLFAMELIFFAVVSLIIALSVAIVPVFFPILRKKIHQIEQYLFHDFFRVKKFMVVKQLDSKIWKLPFEFNNEKLDWNLYGDFKHLIQKVHIKPKDYFEFRWGKPERQSYDWEAVFYFKDIPQKGRMEIIWI